MRLKKRTEGQTEEKDNEENKEQQDKVTVNLDETNTNI